MEYERLIAYFDADITPLKRGAAAATKIIDSLENRIKKFKADLKLNLSSTGSGTRGGADAEMRKAQADIRRMHSERMRLERDYTASVNREARTQASSRVREQKRASNQLIAEIKRVSREEKQQSKKGFLSGIGGSTLLGGLAGGAAFGAVTGITGGLASLASEGRDAYLSLEKLVRFTSTLDRNFQSSSALNKFRQDIEKLSLEVPQSAENIAKASFTIKSAYQNMTEPELINFLRKFSVQATASNTTVDLHADRVAALAKAYKITAEQLDEFGAILSTSFGDALSKDSEVGAGFNKILVSARGVKQPLNEVAAAMGAIQSTSSDAEKNTTNLQNVFSKLSDPKYIAGIKEVFNIDVFDAQGAYKGLNQIVNELAKSMQGLSDKEKSAKIGEVFKDLQAREGLLSLIEVLDQYNQRLRDGADAQAFQNKTDVMLNSAEARWAKFNAAIEQVKRNAGETISSPITSAMASETKAGGVQLGFTELSATIARGILNVGEQLAQGEEAIVGQIDFMTGERTAQQVQAQSDAVALYYENWRRQVSIGAEEVRKEALEGQKKFQDAIIADPNSSSAQITAAKQSSERLGVALKESSQKLASDLFLAYQEIGKKSAEGLKSADPEIQKQAQASAAMLQEELKTMLGRPNFINSVSPDVKGQYEKLFADISKASADALSAGKPQVEQALRDLAAPDLGIFNTTGQLAGSSLISGMQAGLNAQKDEVLAAQNALVQTNTSDASAKGASLGSQFAMGLASGIRSGAGPVGAAVASLIDWAFSSGKEAQKSQSPSKRAAEELGLPFVQGIEVGVRARAQSLQNTVANLINGAMFGGDKKGKKAPQKQTDEMIRTLIGDLGDESSRIDATAGRAEASIKRFYDAILGDQTSGLDTQAASIREYYGKLYDTEETAYQKRLENIAKREEEIRKLRKIKEPDRQRELLKLGDERSGLTGDRDQRRFDTNKDREAAIGEAGGRDVENRQRELIRQQILREIDLVGIRRSAAAEAATQTQDELARIDARIDGYTVERNKFATDSSQFVEFNNKIAEAEQDRADAVVKGSLDARKARKEDLESASDFARSLVDLSRSTGDAQFEADQAKLELLRASGASQEAVFAAEQELAFRQEAFRNQQRLIEIEAQRLSLLSLATTEAQKLQITKEINAQLEAEQLRHNSALGTLTAQQGQNSILGRLREIMNTLPTYTQQFKDFAVGIPDALGNVFGAGLQNFDGTWKSFLEGIKSAFFRTLQEMLAELFRTQLIKGLIGLVGAIGGSLGGGGGSGLGDFGGTSGGGGIFAAEGGLPPVGKVSVVGEQGPELFVPRVAGRILSNEDSRSALSGGSRGGDTYYQSVTNVIKSPRNLVAARSVKQQTEAALTGLSYATKGRK